MGEKTEHQHDGSGSLVAVKDPMVLANPTIPPVTRAYYPNGQLSQVTDKLGRTTYYFYEDEHLNLSRVVDPLGGETKCAYDLAGRRLSITNARGFTTQYEYDSNDNLIRVIDALGRQAVIDYDQYNLPRKTINAAGHIREFTYDAKGMQISRKDANGSTVTYTYDALGRRTSTTDKAGRTTTYKYDDTGNLVEITTPMGTTVSFEYDGNGNLTKTIDARGKQTVNEYSFMGQLTKIEHPQGYAIRYLYRKDGHVEKRWDAKGLWTTYSYDLLGRLIGINYEGDPGAKIDFEYDYNGNLKKMTDPTGPSTFLYDANDRLISFTDPYGKTVSYNYDSIGNRTAINYPEGHTVTYEYDAINRLSIVRDWLGGETTYGYDQAGNLAGAWYPNGTWVNYTYDAANRMTDLVHKRSDGSVLFSYSFTLDHVGNMTHTAVNEPLSAFYQPQNNSLTYDDSNRLISDARFTYTYDNNGNMVQRAGSNGNTTFTYNHENLLTGISGVSAVANVYNGGGQRIARTHNSTQTRYVLDAAASLPSVLAETDSSGVAKAYYVYGLGLISRITPSGSRQIYHFNHRGDTIALTEHSGTITDAYSYDEFGLLLNSTGNTPNPFTFVGEFGVMLEDDGLYFMRARYYSADNGRFISPDPMHFAGGEFNLYSYVSENPLIGIDPEGLKITVENDDKTILATIERLRDGDHQKRKDLIKYLDSSDVEVKVRWLTEAEVKKAKEEKKDPPKGYYPTTNTVIFIKHGSSDEYDNYLAHELGHAEYDIKNPDLNYNIKTKEGYLNACESESYAFINYCDEEKNDANCGKWYGSDYLCYIQPPGVNNRKTNSIMRHIDKVCDFLELYNPHNIVKNILKK